MNTQQISELIGQNFYDVFKPIPNPWMDVDFEALDCDNFEEEYVDLGLPSGTLWSTKIYKYFIWHEAKEKFNLPTREQSLELYYNCKWK